MNYNYTSMEGMIPDEARSLVLVEVEGYGSDNENILTNSSATIDLITMLPIEFREMSQNSKNCVFLYSCLFILGVIGNISVLVSVLRQMFKLRVKTRIMLLILHLSTADLIVTFFLIPMEIFWRISIQWRFGGDFLCKFCQFFRAFGLYLSSLVIICISLDRYFAIIHPLRVFNGKKTVKYMLTCAWILAILSSFPQTLIFSVKSHPVYDFQNCVSIGFFQSQEQEILYNVFSIVVMYFAPLLVIIVTYSLILKKISEKTREHKQIHRFVVDSLKQPVASGNTSPKILDDENEVMLNGQIALPLPHKRVEALKNEIPRPVLRLRRSDNGSSSIMRARNRTLRLTLVIVIAFVLCSTPYIFMVLWYMFDRENASKVDERVQDIFFMMAVANSIANPLIYGTYTKGCNVFCGISSYFRNNKRSQNNSQRSNATRVTALSRNTSHNKLESKNQTNNNNTMTATSVPAPCLQFYTQPNSNQVMSNATIVPIIIPKVHSTHRK